MIRNKMDELVKWFEWCFPNPHEAMHTTHVCEVCGRMVRKMNRHVKWHIAEGIREVPEVTTIESKGPYGYHSRSTTQASREFRSEYPDFTD